MFKCDCDPQPMTKDEYDMAFLACALFPKPLQCQSCKKKKSAYALIGEALKIEPLDDRPASEVYYFKGKS